MGKLVGTTDLELYNHEYSADEILEMITPEIKSLTLNNLGLGDDGLIALMDVFNLLRRQHCTQVDGDWGLQEITIDSDGFTDKGLAAIATYIAGNGRLRALWMSYCFQETIGTLDGLVQALNASSLCTLSLSYNKLDPPAAARFLGEFRSTSLRRLYLNNCYLAGPETIDAVASFLRSKRSRYLSHLHIGKNDLLPDLESVRRIIDAIEARNFALEVLGLEFGKVSTYTLSNSFHIFYAPIAGLSVGEHREVLSEWQRLDRCLKRNVNLTRRTKKAALRCLPTARIIFNDRFLAGRRSSSRQRSNKTNSQSSAAVHATTPRFRLLDLPPDLTDLIVRHTSGDATALSHAQYARIRIDASGKEGLRRVMKAAKDGKTARYTVWGDTKVGSKEEWLESQGLSKWEKDVYDD